MSFSKGKKDTSSYNTNTSTQTLDPALSGALYGNLNSAQNLASGYQGYNGQLVAGLNGQQQQSFQGAQNIFDNQTGAGATNAGVTAAQGVAGYQPSQVQAGQLSNTDLSPYLNPYQQDVTNATMNDLSRQWQMGNQNANAAATQAGAFGGSRSAVLNDLNNKSYGRTAASTLAGLNAANFNQAQGAASQDIGNRLSAAQGNQNAGLAGAGLNLQGAGLLGQLGQQQLGNAQTRLGLLNGAGNQQQAQDQSVLTANQNQYQQNLQNRMNLQQLLNQSTGLLPTYGTTNSSGTGKSHTTDTQFKVTGSDIAKAASGFGF